MPRECIVAIGLLTREDLALLGPQFERAYPVDQAPCFGELIHAIDEAERELWRARDSAQPGPAIMHLPWRRGA